jgi:hypothetical protein
VNEVNPVPAETMSDNRNETEKQQLKRLNRRAILAILGGTAAALGTAAFLFRGHGMNRESAILRFARDFSGNDPALMEKMQAFENDPPTKIEDIGFYSAEDYPATTRLFYAAVNLLDNAGHIQSAEDKYMNELLGKWRDQGLIEIDRLPPEARQLFGTLLDPAFFEETGDAPRIADFRKFAWDNYARATEQLEAHINARGRTLLSIDATGGDTVFFALVEPALAGRWRDRALSEQDGYRGGVRAPMWDRVWQHLTYTYYPDLLAAPDSTGIPPGTRLRRDDIPFAE